MIKLATQLVILLLCAKLHFGGIMVLIKITQGFLEGEAVLNEYGGTYYSFKGIPYARPPIGDLRFKAPQPALPWKDIRSAKEFGPVCPQSNFLLPNLGNMSEDCLYINVYTPDTQPKQLLPVMVWIHGGGYVWGSGNDDFYGPQFLIRHGVILVTFNYRLEALGFLCLHTADVPGNAGMKDQVAALKWVKENIESFGGNPQNITIFGESAGASSVSYHLISPMSRGLFRRAITQSGAATCWWSQDFASRDKALLLAKQLGCFSEDDKIVYEFLKQQPYESLITLKLQVWKAQKPYEIFFAIANEKDFGQERFFYGDITDVLRTDAYKGVEVLTGYTKDEWAMTLAFEYSLENMINDAKYFNDFFVPRWIKTHCVIADQLEVGRKMRQFYFKDGDVTEHGVIKFLNMDMFVYGIYVSAKFYSTKTTVYLYKLTCVSERNFMGRNLGLTELTQYNSLMCHADDLAYLFPLKDLTEKVDVKSDCFKSIETISKLWTNFAKYGNPTPDNSLGVYWRPFTLPTQEYLEFGNELTIKHSPEKEELEFWDNIFKEYVPNIVI